MEVFRPKPPISESAKVFLVGAFAVKGVREAVRIWRRSERHVAHKTAPNHQMLQPPPPPRVEIIPFERESLSLQNAIVVFNKVAKAKPRLENIHGSGSYELLMLTTRPVSVRQPQPETPPDNLPPGLS